MKADYVVTTYKEHKMGFLFENSDLTEARLFSDAELVGSICTATVDKIVPTMDAAFLTGPDGLTFFYHLKENDGRHIVLRRRGRGKDREIAVGDTILVQVSAEAQKKKQAEATAKLELAGDCIIANRTGQVGISKKIMDPERKEALKTLLTDILQKKVSKDEGSERDPSGEILLRDSDFDGFGLIARTSAERVPEEQIREVSIILLCKLKALIRSAETIPEHRWVFRGGQTPEGYTSDLIRSGLYESVVVHTDLPWNSADVYGDASPGKEPELVDPDVIERMISHGRNMEDHGSYHLHRMLPGESSPLIIFNIPVSLEKAMARKVFLKSGGYLYVEPTEAMTVIDVNSGKNIKEKSHEEGAYAQNLEAAAEIARLLRLRNISGMIMIDFISMKQAEHERSLMAALREFTKNDPCHVRVVDITRLGIVEVTREKKLPPLSEQLP